MFEKVEWKNSVSDRIYWSPLIWGVFPLSCRHSVFWLNNFRLRKRVWWNKVDIVRCVPHIVSGFFFSQAGETLFPFSQFHFGLWGSQLYSHWGCRGGSNNYLRRHDNYWDWLIRDCFSGSSRRKRDASHFSTGCNLRCSCCFCRGCNFQSNRLFSV